MIQFLFALAVMAPAKNPQCDSIKTTDLIACAADSYETADAALNATWKKLPKSEELVRAQKAWIAFRDAECEAANPAEPQGREYPIHRLVCLSNLTNQRTKQLHEHYGSEIAK